MKETTMILRRECSIDFDSMMKEKVQVDENVDLPLIRCDNNWLKNEVYYTYTSTCTKYEKVDWFEFREASRRLDCRKNSEIFFHRASFSAIRRANC